MRCLSLSRRLLFASIAIVLSSGSSCWNAVEAQSLRMVPALNSVAPLTNLMNGPTAVALDAAGNLYVADTSHGMIRKVDPTQTATVVAGQGVNFFGGDGGPAVNAYLNFPNALAVDSFGNLYIADGYNYRVRKIDTAGIITTFAGGNGSGSSGEGVAATSAQIVAAAITSDSAGNIYLLDSISLTVRVVNSAGVISTFAGGGSPPSGNGDGGPKLGAKFISPTSLAIDSNGNLYVGDSGTYSVRKIDISGNVSTFAGTTYGNSGNGGQAVLAQFQSLAGVATDPAGSVYITDTTARMVRVVNAAGVISTLAGFGQSSTVFDGRPADQARIGGPVGIAADGSGNVFFSVTSTNAAYVVIQHPERFPQTKVGAFSQTQRLILENVGAADIKLSAFSFASDFGLATTNLANANPCGQTTTLFAGASNNICTFDVAFTPTAEGIRSFPLTVTSNDTPVTLTQTLTSTGLGSALAMTSGQMFIVAGSHGAPAANRGDNGPATSASLNDLLGLVVDSSGNMYFSEYPYCQVRRVDGKTGIITTIAGTHPLNCDSVLSGGDGAAATAAVIRTPGPIALDASNNIYITAILDGRIRWIDSGGIIHTYAGTGVSSGTINSCGYSGDGGPAVAARLCGPWGISFDTHGNMFVADSGNNVIRMITPGGTISTVAGKNSLGAGFSGDGGLATDAQLNAPRYVVVNAAGDMFISDSTNQVIRKVTAATGKISTIAGTHGTTGYRNDGSSAAGALFNSPQGIALDAAGDLFVADADNMVIRKIDTAGNITSIAGNHLVYDGYNGDGLPATSTYLAFPQDVFVSASGYLYINDQSNQVVRQVSPNGTLTFPLQSVGSTSAAQAVTVSNVGNMPMHFDSQFPTGLTGDFTVASGGTCDFAQALAVGANCTVNIAFAPTANGGRFGIFAFYDDGVAAPQLVSLFGTGATVSAQTINFPGPATPVTYGAAAVPLSATASSGLPVSFSVTGPGSIGKGGLRIAGAGTITVTAMQAGDATHAAATPVSRSIVVNPAVLQVGVIGAPTRPFGQPNPSFDYSISGYVNSDPASVVTGTPDMTTSAIPKSPAGPYPITVGQGTLAASNYTFNFANGTLTVSGGAPQFVYFPTIGNFAHGTTLQLVGFASSGLPVSFAVTSGAATVSGSVLTITGTGQVQVTASQAGSTSFSAASPVTRTFIAQ